MGINSPLDAASAAIPHRGMEMVHDSQNSASDKTVATPEAFEETGNAAAKPNEPKTMPTPKSMKVKASRTKVTSIMAIA
jgi:hypothetical protein